MGDFRFGDVVTYKEGAGAVRIMVIAQSSEVASFPTGDGYAVWKGRWVGFTLDDGFGNTADEGAFPHGETCWMPDGSDSWVMEKVE